MKTPIDYINNEELHDMPVAGFSADFENACFTLDFLQFDDILSDYVSLKWELSGLFLFESDFTGNFLFAETECFTHSCHETKKGFCLKLELTDSRRNFWYLTIGFTSLRTEGGLSEKARAARAAYFEEQTG